MARSERGSTAPLIVGFLLVLLLVIAFVIDATAAYLRHSGLAVLADGAALRAADAGSTGAELYEQGVTAAALKVDATRARQAVADYLRDVGAFGRYPGLAVAVTVDDNRVAVRLTSRLDLPLTVPGAPSTPPVSATSSAAVLPDL